MGILAVVDGFITPRPRRGAVLCPPVWATPFNELPPRSGIGVGLGIPPRDETGAGAGAGAKTGAGPVGAGGLGAAGFGIGADADAAAGPGAGLGAGAGIELTIGTETGGGIGAEASLEGAPGAKPVFLPDAATGLNPTFDDCDGFGFGAATDLKPLTGFEAAGLAAAGLAATGLGEAGTVEDSLGVGAHLVADGIGSAIGVKAGGSILPFPGEEGTVHAGVTTGFGAGVGATTGAEAEAGRVLAGLAGCWVGGEAFMTMVS